MQKIRQNATGIRGRNMLSINNVSKKYGKVLANDNISFQVEDGQIAVLVVDHGMRVTSRWRTSVITSYSIHYTKLYEYY